MAGTGRINFDLPDELDDIPTPSAASSRSNPLANKFTSVLSASYTDSDLRNALRMLDEKQLKNTRDTRRKLHLNAQKEVIGHNSDIVQDFGHVAQQLKQIGRAIQDLNQCCEDIKSHVSAARRDSVPILEDASSLFAQRSELGTKSQLLESFVAHFIIPNEDLAVLTAASDIITDDFFVALDKLKGIHADCRILLGGEHQRLGLELMDESSRYLNQAFQNLSRWMKKEFEDLDFEAPQIGATIRQALRVIAEKPLLFQGCLDAFVKARERVMTDSFHMALTGSANGPNDSSMKPLEYHAHDPLRYVGDMLAWIYSALVSEREALERLLVAEEDKLKQGFELGQATEPWSLGDSEGFEGRKILDDLVNRNMSGVAEILHQRVEQVLQNHEDAILLFKINNLVRFYHETLCKLLEPKSALLGTLWNLEESSMRHFQTVVTENVSSINADCTAPPHQLEIPEFLKQSLAQVAVLLKIYDSSLTSATSRITDFEPILVKALDPYVSLCEQMVSKSVEPITSIFTANFLLAIKSTLATYDFVQTRASQLEEQLDACTSSLKEYQHSFFLYTSGLHPLLASLAPLGENGEDLDRVRGLAPTQPQALSDASQTLDDFLPSALMDAMEGLKFLSNPRLAREITEEGADRFCEDFEYIEHRLAAVDEWSEAQQGDAPSEAVEKESIKQTSLKSLFPRTSDEIRVLLS